MTKIWEGLLESPLKGRNSKPRESGVTMIIDKGLSLVETEELLKMNAPFIDFIKLSFGTTALYPQNLLIRKIELVKEYAVEIYPGGTFFEVALWQNKATKYFQKLQELGFSWVEISDGSMDIGEEQRKKSIEDAKINNLKVISEVGKKSSQNQPDDHDLIKMATQDLAEGVEYVIIEARESGQGIGIYDNKGAIITEKLNTLSQTLPIDKIIWEAPLKGQQAALINNFGPNVNLGNIPPTEAMALEALRLGYRSDTWKI